MYPAGGCPCPSPRRIAPPAGPFHPRRVCLTAVLVVVCGGLHATKAFDGRLREAFGRFPNIVRWSVAIPADLALDSAADLPVVDKMVDDVLCGGFRFSFGCGRGRCSHSEFVRSLRHLGYPIDAHAV